MVLPSGSQKPLTVFPSALAPVAGFFQRHAPFDALAAADLEFLAAHVQLAFHPRGAVITEPERGPAQTFYIIKQGRVRGEAIDDRAPAEDGAWELVAGECFPIGALMAHRAVRTRQRAIDDTFCFELPRADFEQLVKTSPVFHDFCSRRLAHLLDQALLHVQAGLVAEVSQHTASGVPLGTLVRRAPVTCRPETSVRAAAAMLDAERVGSIVITDADARPLGMFTLRDLVARVIARDVDLDAAIERVMTRAPETLPPDVPAYEAALLMARRGFGHVCVERAGKLIGVVSERDLFSLQRVGLVSVSRAIIGAPDVPTLVGLARDTHRLIDQMLVQGVAVEQLTLIVTLLNDHLTRRVIELALARRERPPPAFTWLSFGSEGRREQTLTSDQDNGMLFALPPGRSADSVRAELLPLAAQVNRALADCGFALCRGDVMAASPQCCLSIDEWRARFGNWIEHGAPDDLLKASIFFDLRALYGECAPVEALRDFMHARVAATPRFLRQLAVNVLTNAPPLGLVRDFDVASGGEHPHTIDLKLKGTRPIVDGARLLALAHGIGETNTAMRLRAAAETGAVPPAEADAWRAALGFLTLLRMRGGHADGRTRTPSNHVDPDELNELDRRILKESFRQVRKLQTRIALDYRL